MDEAERRKRVIANGQTDLERWADPARLEAMWQARSVLAADLVPAGSRVLELGCGAMTLERYLPFGCSYQPCDVVARDERTIVTDLNTHGVPEAALAACDLVVMLGLWEYLFDPGEIFATLARAGRPILCSYCPAELTAHLDRSDQRVPARGGRRRPGPPRWPGDLEGPAARPLDPADPAASEGVLRARSSAALRADERR